MNFHRSIPIVWLSMLVIAAISCRTGNAQDSKQRADSPPDRDYSANLNLRGNFNLSREVFDETKQGTVAFIGGSITEMNGYRPIVSEILQKRFPETKFTFVNAGISSTGSTTGAFRLNEHVLSKGKIDLLFVEFAVNDDQDGMHAQRECMRGMEGVIRQIRQHNPRCDVVITYFCNLGMIGKIQIGEQPVSIAAHEKVAEHYSVPTVNLAAEVAGQITAKTVTWEKYGGTHPKKFGNTICAHMIRQMMFDSWKDDSKDAKPHAIPDELLDENSYVRGRLGFFSVKPDENWKKETPAWKTLKGSCRSRFVDLKLLSADKPGSSLKLKFSGTAIGAYVLAGPDAGQVEVTIDGNKHDDVELYHRHSAGLHYPRTVMFAADLENGEHELELKISPTNNEKSIGHAIRIIKFAAN